MSTIKVDTIRNYDSAVDFSQGFKVGGVDIVQNYTESATVPETPTPVNGDYWWDTANDILYRYMDGGFRALGEATPIVFTWGGDRGVFAGGDEGSGSVNRIQYIDITTPGNSSDFGDLNYWSYKSGGGCTDGTTAQFAGGFGKLTNDPYGTVDIIEKITIQTTGNATNFGSITQSNDGSNGAGA